ncbi:hypothetical protein M0R89_04825 [Halorussus limi]|uniref:Uncharacterized protein n=1 Tax=Halorussus limi TaxID=2938695 RepID=A0A8U0HWB3_9EURY|nr:hypothetical protein [Halorussus limi]UPV75392.1 hypothetical protein M0R89_04825 [Halorussus limi]
METTRTVRIVGSSILLLSVLSVAGLGVVSGIFDSERCCEKPSANVEYNQSVDGSSHRLTINLTELSDASHVSVHESYAEGHGQYASLDEVGDSVTVRVLQPGEILILEVHTECDTSRVVDVYEVK